MKNTEKKSGLRHRSQIHFNDASLTAQQFKSECDINTILKRYALTGQLPHKQGQYLDLSNLPSYADAMNTICKANEAFDSLSASVRKRFNNDPAQLVAFVSDASNLPEMVKLGLATKQDLKGADSSPSPNKTASSPGAAVPAVGEGPASGGKE